MYQLAQMTRDDLIALAKKTANKYGLFPAFVDFSVRYPFREYE